MTAPYVPPPETTMRQRCPFCCRANDGRSIPISDNRYVRHLTGAGMPCSGSGKSIDALPPLAGCSMSESHVPPVGTPPPSEPPPQPAGPQPSGPGRVTAGARPWPHGPGPGAPGGPTGPGRTLTWLDRQRITDRWNAALDLIRAGDVLREVGRYGYDLTVERVGYHQAEQAWDRINRRAS